MRLHQLPSSPPGSHKRTKRKGIGEGSGHGKTSTRGNKGQRARSGSVGVHLGFQGGAIPLYRTLPHRGFNQYKFRTVFNVINLRDLSKLEGNIVNGKSLVEAGLIRDNSNPIKLLGDGEVTQSYTVTVSKVSASAKAKIEAAGGSVTVSL